MNELKTLLEGIYGFKQLYHPLELKGFEDWHVVRPGNRFRPIRRTLASLGIGAGATHIDIGCNAGGLCRDLSKFGLESIGYDIDATCIKAANLINSLAPDLPKPPKFALGQWRGESADVITCLSVFHRFFETQSATLLATYKQMAASSRVFITDCVVEPAETCRKWTVQGFRAWLLEHCRKPVYVLDTSDTRPLFVVTELPIVRDYGEHYERLKASALSQRTASMPSWQFPAWFGVNLQTMEHFPLFSDFEAGRPVGKGHPYIEQYLMRQLGHSRQKATALVKSRKDMFESIRANGIQVPVEVVLDEFGVRRLDGHHRATCALVLGLKIPLLIFDMVNP